MYVSFFFEAEDIFETLFEEIWIKEIDSIFFASFFLI